MDPITIVNGIIAAADAIDKIKTLFSGKPKVTNPVAEIKPYLTAILQGMEAIRQQNIAIYEKVSQLPLVIGAMVTEILEAHGLKERYIELSGLRAQFESMGAAAQLDVVTSSGYSQLTTNLYYIFQNEPKIGSLGQMCAFMDFADLATKQQSEIRKGLSAIVYSREQKMSSLLSVLIEQFTSQFNAIQLMMNSTYFAENNVAIIKSVRELKFVAASDRYVTETYTTTTRRPVNDGTHCCQTRWETITESHQREVIDSPFSAARNSAVNELALLIKKAVDSEDAIGAVRNDLVILNWYREEMLSQNSLSEVVSFIVEPDEKDMLEKGYGDNLPIPAFIPRRGNCYSQ